MTRRRSLNNDQLRDVFALRKHGISYAGIAKIVGVGASTIRDAVQLRTAYAAAAVVKGKGK